MESGGAGMGAGLFFAIMLVLFLGWLLTGGPHELSSTKIFSLPGAYIGPDSGANSGPVTTAGYSTGAPSNYSSDYGIFGNSAPATLDTSPLAGKLELEDVSSSYGNVTAGDQYATIYAPLSNTSSIDLSALSIKSVITETSQSLGEGTGLPFANQVNGTSDIELAPGQTAIIDVGASPIGVSFRENACVGFLGQHQNFTPSLDSDCPKPPASSIPIPPGADLYACTEYMQSVPSCTTPNYSSEQSESLAQEGVSEACQNYAETELTYDNCVTGDKSSPDFFGDTWRLYLNRSSPLWQEHDTVEILDQNGLVVAHDTY